MSERSKELHDEFIKIGDTSDLLGNMTSEGHRRLGQFLCLFKNDWLPGLLHLAAGDDKQWGNLARSDLTAHVTQDRPGNDGTTALAAAGSQLALHFQGDRVYLVMKPVAATGKVRVYLNDQIVPQGGASDGWLTVDSDRLYTVINQPGLGSGLLKLEFAGPLEVFAFTFG